MIREAEKIASWIGTIRQRYGDNITDAHENEMYEFLSNKDNMNSIGNKLNFEQRLAGIVGNAFFDAKEPLNLARIKHQSQGEREYNREFTELKGKIKELDDKIKELKERRALSSVPEEREAADTAIQKEEEQRSVQQIHARGRKPNLFI